MAGILPADWPAPPRVRAFTTLRNGPGTSLPPYELFNLGARCGDVPSSVQANRDAFASRFELPSAPAWLQQVHGVAVARIDSRIPLATTRAQSESTVEPIADASVSSTPGVVLAILTADCLPVLFCNRDGSEIGATHAGWRGLAAGVLEATVAAMRSPPESLLAWLGPAAGPMAYEVGEEVRDAFLSAHSEAASAFTQTRAGHWHVDLYLLARQRLAASGVTGVFGGGLCTISDPARFYSHRRDAVTGRMATVIVAKA